MRARNLKPGFFGNEELGRLPFEDRILFEGLWCLSDKEGFFENRPDKIAALIFPYDKKIDGQRVTVMLNRLMSRRLITLIDTHGYVPTFLVHNNPHPHEAKSIVPEQIKNILKNLCNDMPVTKPLQAGLNPESLLLNPESLNPPISPLPPKRGGDSFFEQFWKVYPKRQGKERAVQAWKKLKPDTALCNAIVESVRQHCLTDQWQKNKGEYIPMPATFLNGKRWLDELNLERGSPSQIECERERESEKFKAETELAAKKLFGG